MANETGAQSEKCLVLVSKFLIIGFVLRDYNTFIRVCFNWDGFVPTGGMFAYSQMCPDHHRNIYIFVCTSYIVSAYAKATRKMSDVRNAVHLIKCHIFEIQFLDDLFILAFKLE